MSSENYRIEKQDSIFDFILHQPATKPNWNRFQSFIHNLPGLEISKVF